MKWVAVLLAMMIGMVSYVSYDTQSVQVMEPAIVDVDAPVAVAEPVEEEPAVDEPVPEPEETAAASGVTPELIEEGLVWAQTFESLWNEKDSALVFDYMSIENDTSEYFPSVMAGVLGDHIYFDLYLVTYTGDLWMWMILDGASLTQGNVAEYELAFVEAVVAAIETYTGTMDEDVRAELTARVQEIGTGLITGEIEDDGGDDSFYYESLGVDMDYDADTNEMSCYLGF